MTQNPYHQLVSDFSSLLTKGRGLPLGGFAPAAKPAIAANAAKALFFAPHPDDECIVGGLALRLLRQARMNVINVPVTYGSKKERQLERFAELQGACGYLGYGIEPVAPRGLEKINPKTRQQDAAHWSGCVESVLAVIRKHQPKVVCCPHAQDWNSTHIGTHFLVLDALAKMPAEFQCYVVETEFWGAMTDPNLMVEMSASDLADMIAATTFHVGEVARNPYHLLLAPWMMDNVRRGSEVVGGQGGATPDFAFAVLNRLRKWSNGQLSRVFEGGRFVPDSMNVAELFA